MIDLNPSPVRSAHLTAETLPRSTSRVVRCAMQYARVGDSLQVPCSRNALEKAQKRHRSIPTRTPGRHSTVPFPTSNSRCGFSVIPFSAIARACQGPPCVLSPRRIVGPGWFQGLPAGQKATVFGEQGAMPDQAPPFPSITIVDPEARTSEFPTDAGTSGITGACTSPWGLPDEEWAPLSPRYGVPVFLLYHSSKPLAVYGLPAVVMPPRHPAFDRDRASDAPAATPAVRALEGGRHRSSWCGEPFQGSP